MSSWGQLVAALGTLGPGGLPGKTSLKGTSGGLSLRRRCEKFHQPWCNPHQSNQKLSFVKKNMHQVCGSCTPFMGTGSKYTRNWTTAHPSHISCCQAQEDGLMTVYYQKRKGFHMSPHVFVLLLEFWKGIYSYAGFTLQLLHQLMMTGPTGQPYRLC